MNVKKMDFPSEIKNRLQNKIRQSIKMTFYNGATIEIDNFNLSILEPYKVLFKKRNKVIIVYITENKLSAKRHYNFFANVISQQSKHSLNSLINIINDNLG